MWPMRPTGRIVWQKHESGNALKQAGYLMDVDVRPGNYTLVAWCGEGHRTSFGVDDGDNVSPTCGAGWSQGRLRPTARAGM